MPHRVVSNLSHATLLRRQCKANHTIAIDQIIVNLKTSRDRLIHNIAWCANRDIINAFTSSYHQTHFHLSKFDPPASSDGLSLALEFIATVALRERISSALDRLVLINRTATA